MSLVVIHLLEKLTIRDAEMYMEVYRSTNKSQPIMIRYPHPPEKK